MNEDDQDIVGLLQATIQNDDSLAEFTRTWSPLMAFLNEYEHQKGIKGMTQKEVATACGTTQSAISRLERLRGKPTYELLRRLSAAVGGELFLSPLADVSLTLPLDLHGTVRGLAAKKGVKTQDFLHGVLREGITNAQYWDAFTVADHQEIITLNKRDIPVGQYAGSGAAPQELKPCGSLADCTWAEAV